MLPMSALNQPHYGECLDEVDGSHEYFFRLHHPDRERFEREGWPTEQAAAEAK